MRSTTFIIFFAIFFSIYGGLNYYLFIRGWQAIPQGWPYRHWYARLFWATTSSFIAGRLLERIGFPL